MRKTGCPPLMQLRMLNTKKEPTEMERVTENIAQVEGEIQQKVYQLGQLYYEEHKADEAADSQYCSFASLFSAFPTIHSFSLHRHKEKPFRLRFLLMLLCSYVSASRGR